MNDITPEESRCLALLPVGRLAAIHFPQLEAAVFPDHPPEKTGSSARCLVQSLRRKGYVQIISGQCGVYLSDDPKEIKGCAFALIRKGAQTILTGKSMLGDAFAELMGQEVIAGLEKLRRLEARDGVR